MTQEDVVADGFLSLAEAQRYLAVSRPTLLKMIDDGVIPTATFGSWRRVPRAWLKTYAVSRLTNNKEVE